jgi:hypothetical protein
MAQPQGVADLLDQLEVGGNTRDGVEVELSICHRHRPQALVAPALRTEADFGVKIRGGAI